MPRARGRLFVSAVFTAVLAVGVMGVPAAAANAKLAILNGIPGKTVDVCVGAKEVKSGLAYGRWFQRSQAPGERTLRFRVASAGTCKGKVLAKRTMTIASGADLTIVATKDAPKVIDFDNDGLGTLGSEAGVDFGYIAVRHAGDMGAAVMRYLMGSLAYTPVTPAAEPTFVKDDEFTGLSYASPTDLMVYATPPGSLVVFASTVRYLQGARRVETILVGSTRANARLVVISRPIAL